MKVELQGALILPDIGSFQKNKELFQIVWLISSGIYGWRSEMKEVLLLLMKTLSLNLKYANDILMEMFMLGTIETEKGLSFSL